MEKKKEETEYIKVCEDNGDARYWWPTGKFGLLSRDIARQHEQLWRVAECEAVPVTSKLFEELLPQMAEVGTERPHIYGEDFEKVLEEYAENPYKQRCNGKHN